MSRKVREKKISVQVKLTPDQHRKIEIMCERLSCNKSYYIRSLLDEALKEVQVVESRDYDQPIPGI